MLNTRLRTAVKNKFEKDSFKFFKRSVFGKTVENIRSHKDIKLATSQEKYGNYVMKTNVKDEYPFLKEIFVFSEIKKNRDQDKQISITWKATLNLRKTLMYKFHYD